jgi:hypothetical protein
MLDDHLSFANHNVMVSRLIALVGCVLLAGSPAINAARIAEHAREHADAQSGHSHSRGNTPHHQHESDGDPVPASHRLVDHAIRLPHSSSDQAPLVSVEMAPVAQALADWHLPSISLVTEPLGFHEPPGPSPGHILPLRI